MALARRPAQGGEAMMSEWRRRREERRRRRTIEAWRDEYGGIDAVVEMTARMEELWAAVHRAAHQAAMAGTPRDGYIAGRVNRVLDERWTYWRDLYYAAGNLQFSEQRKAAKR
jgi:hypothetical protein